MMQSTRSASIVCPRRWMAGLSMLGALLGACSDPAAVDAPARVPINAAVVPTSGLVGEWKLDEPNGTIAHDTWVNHFDATVFGGAAFVGGKLGNALKLDN